MWGFFKDVHVSGHGGQTQLKQEVSDLKIWKEWDYPQRIRLDKPYGKHEDIYLPKGVSGDASYFKGYTRLSATNYSTMGHSIKNDLLITKYKESSNPPYQEIISINPPLPLSSKKTTEANGMSTVTTTEKDTPIKTAYIGIAIVGLIILILLIRRRS